MSSHIFHLAFPIGNIPDTKTFYIEGLGCSAGRENQSSIILNLGGHQLVGHISPEFPPQLGIYPRHFGLVFSSEAEWQQLLDRAQAHNLKFRDPARRRFPSQPLEHLTFFLEDPFNNLLEFKHYLNPEAIFGLQDLKTIGDAP